MKGGGRLSHTEYTRPISSGEDCTTLKFETILTKITPAGSVLTIGEQLVIKLLPSDVIGAYNKSGALCGNISSPFNIQLIECINKGNQYRGTVLDTTKSINIEFAK